MSKMGRKFPWSKNHILETSAFADIIITMQGDFWELENNIFNTFFFAMANGETLKAFLSYWMKSSNCTEQHNSVN